MPLAAMCALSCSLNRHLPTSVVFCVITMPMGFVFLFRSLWVIIRTKAP